MIKFFHYKNSKREFKSCKHQDVSISSHVQNIFTQTGFTLLETIIATTILIFGILGPLYLAQQSVKAVQLQKERLTASGLAQEGIEVIRNKIQNNIASTNDYTQWLNGISDKCAPAAFGCAVNPLNLSQPIKNVLDTDTIVFQNINSGVYAQEVSLYDDPDWIESPFTRQVIVTPTFNNAVTVTSRVTWKNQTKNYVLSSIIYNWFPENL